MNDKYNWEILQKYLDVSEEAKNFEENREKINEEIERIEKLYFEKNMALKKEQIQVFYDERINKTKERKEIINKLNAALKLFVLMFLFNSSNILIPENSILIK